MLVHAGTGGSTHAEPAASVVAMAAIVAGLSMLGQFAIATYLPAFAVMGDDRRTFRLPYKNRPSG
jgi:hypothetical protein